MFISWLVSRNEEILIFGVLFLVASIFLFALGLLTLLLAVKEFRKNNLEYRSKLLIGLTLLVLNFPIGLAYISCVEYIIGTSHVMITNNSDEVIDTITFTDPAGKQHILRNIPAESKSVEEFHFKGEGSVNYNVLSKSINSSGIAIEYITFDMPAKFQIEISRDKNLIMSK